MKQAPEAGEKHKAQQLSDKAEIINTDSEICGQNTAYKALFKNRYWIWIVWTENSHMNIHFFQF